MMTILNYLSTYLPMNQQYLKEREALHDYFKIVLDEKSKINTPSNKEKLDKEFEKFQIIENDVVQTMPTAF